MTDPFCKPKPNEELKIERCSDCRHWERWKNRCRLGYSTRASSPPCRQALPKKNAETSMKLEESQLKVTGMEIERYLSQKNIFGKSGISEEFACLSSSGSQDPQKPSCPQCGSLEVNRHGFIYSSDREPVQRWICKGCGRRFSFGQVTNNAFKHSRRQPNCQICVTLKEAKNLVTSTETKTVGEVGKTQQEVKGRIIQYAMALRNKGRNAETIRTYVGALYTLINKGANLLDPSDVEEVIAKQEQWSLRAKRNYTDWYSRFAKFLRMDWEKPNYKAPTKIPFFPLESEIEQIIIGSPRKTSIALQIAKETAARVGEIVRLKWTDIDFNVNTIAINEPEKGSNTGIYKVTPELIARIQTLPRIGDRIFGKASSDTLANMLLTAKRKLASNLCNPRLLKIHFHTLRHWKLTNYAHKVKDPFMVQMFARHKDLKCTSRYIHYEKIVYETSDKNEWIVKAAKTVEEASELIEVGFEYHVEIDGFKLFRKRK